MPRASRNVRLITPVWVIAPKCAASLSWCNASVQDRSTVTCDSCGADLSGLLCKATELAWMVGTPSAWPIMSRLCGVGSIQLLRGVACLRNNPSTEPITVGCRQAGGTGQSDRSTQHNRSLAESAAEPCRKPHLRTTPGQHQFRSCSLQ